MHLSRGQYRFQLIRDGRLVANGDDEGQVLLSPPLLGAHDGCAMFMRRPPPPNGSRSRPPTASPSGRLPLPRPPHDATLSRRRQRPASTPRYLTLRSRLVEIRAAQRTFEGAYTRTAIAQFSFALVVLKIFTSEFYPIGALFAVYGAAVLLVAIYRRYEGNRQFFSREELVDIPEDDEDPADPPPADADGSHQARRWSAYRRRRASAVVVKKKFRTSGNSVTLLAFLSLLAYAALLALLWNLAS